MGHPVHQLEFSSPIFDGVIPSGAVLQAERGISLLHGCVVTEIHRPAGKCAGLLDDAGRADFKLRRRVVQAFDLAGTTKKRAPHFLVAPARSKIEANPPKSKAGLTCVLHVFGMTKFYGITGPNPEPKPNPETHGSLRPPGRATLCGAPACRTLVVLDSWQFADSAR